MSSESFFQEIRNITDLSNRLNIKGGNKLVPDLTNHKSKSRISRSYHLFNYYSQALTTIHFSTIPWYNLFFSSTAHLNSKEMDIQDLAL